MIIIAFLRNGSMHYKRKASVTFRNFQIAVFIFTYLWAPFTDLISAFIHIQHTLFRVPYDSRMFFKYLRNNAKNQSHLFAAMSGFISPHVCLLCSFPLAV